MKEKYAGISALLAAVCQFQELSKAEGPLEASLEEKVVDDEQRRVASIRRKWGRKIEKLDWRKLEHAGMPISFL